MKKKIITFLSILAVSSISCGGILANACARNSASNSTFSCEATGNHIKLTSNNTGATVFALNSSDYYNYKYVEVTTYKCNGPYDFDELNYSSNSGNTISVHINTSSTNADNIFSLGIIGNAQNAQAGSHYFAFTNTKKPSTPYYLDSSYYTVYLSFEG